MKYLFATLILAGAIQFGAGILKLGRFIRLVPHPVMIGFVNGLAIVIGLGGVGSHAAVGLARAGIGRLRLIDFDTVDTASALQPEDFAFIPPEGADLFYYDE